MNGVRLLFVTSIAVLLSDFKASCNICAVQAMFTRSTLASLRTLHSKTHSVYFHKPCRRMHSTSIMTRDGQHRIGMAFTPMNFNSNPPKYTLAFPLASSRILRLDRNSHCSWLIRHVSSLTNRVADSVALRATSSHIVTDTDANVPSPSVITRDLNPSQKEATLRPRYSITRVIAGPGAGKTRVLTCRIAHLLLDCRGVENQEPEGILAVTFTKKSAMEMERRLGELLSSSAEVMSKESQPLTCRNDNYEIEKFVMEENASPLDDDNTSDLVRNLMRHTTVGTFHSVCSKILRRFGPELGHLPSVRRSIGKGGIMELTQTLDASFNIIDQSDQLRLLKEVLQVEKIELKSDFGSRNDDIRPITVLNAISLLNTEDAVMSTIKVQQDSLTEDASKKMSRKVREIAGQIRISFQTKKYLQNSVDFDDLILLTRELLLCHPYVREYLHRRWRHILVDEFQDTSQVQLDLVRLLTTNSLFVVGDGDQSIYSWRGASPESMSHFEQAFHDKIHAWEGLVDHHPTNINENLAQIHSTTPRLQVKSVYLMENYRSTSNIVKAAQRVISASDGRETDTQDNIRRDMKPMRGSGPSPRVLACRDAKAEAVFAVKAVISMIEGGELTPASTVAMIYRTNAQSRLLEEACVEHNLRYVVRGSSGTFYKRAEIQDCLCFLKIMHNGRDRSAWARAVKAPSRGIGETSLEEFFRYCDAVTDIYAEIPVKDFGPPSPMDVLLTFCDGHVSNKIHELIQPREIISSRALNKFIPFASSLAALKKKTEVETVNQFIFSVIEDLNLRTHFDSISKTREEFEDRMSNVMELIRAANRYKDDGPCISNNVDNASESPIGRFLDDVALIADIDPNTDDAENSSGGILVANLMTIHSSKGMEFDAVFLVGNEEGTFPTQSAIGQGEGSVELSEERRLCYVAMTRAKTHLLMTWRREVQYFAGSVIKTRAAVRSRFLNILVNEHVGTPLKSLPNSASRPLQNQINQGKAPPGMKRKLHTDSTMQSRLNPKMDESTDTNRANNRKWDDWEPAKQRLLSQQTQLINKKVNPVTIPQRYPEKQKDAHPTQMQSANSYRETKNWDNWEPTKLRKSIEQTPVISSTLIPATRSTTLLHSTPQQNFETKDKRNVVTRRLTTHDAKKKQPVIPISSEMGRSVTTTFQSDPPPQIDSTLFFPIGSSVKHKMYGRGVVIPPPHSDEEFAEKMLVRVKFADDSMDWDLPMDSLVHTYE